MNSCFAGALLLPSLAYERLCGNTLNAATRLLYTNLKRDRA